MKTYGKWFAAVFIVCVKDVSQFQVNVKMSSYSLSFCSVKQAADSVSDPIMQIGI